MPTITARFKDIVKMVGSEMDLDQFAVGKRGVHITQHNTSVCSLLIALGEILEPDQVIWIHGRRLVALG